MGGRRLGWRRWVLVPVAGATIVAATSCTYWNVNFGQWSAGQTRNAVIALGDYYDIKPFTYPGHDPASYKAADFMLPDGGRNGEGSYWVQRGWQLAHAAQANTAVQYVVFRQHIWNRARAGEGWRLMANRGSWTQNHMDHVHVSFR